MFTSDFLRATSKHLFRIDEVAHLFACHPNTIRNWCDSGRLLFIRTPGGQRRIPRAALLQYGLSPNS